MPSMHHNNQTLLQVSYLWNFLHRLARSYWYSYESYEGKFKAGLVQLFLCLGDEQQSNFCVARCEHRVLHVRTPHMGCSHIIFHGSAGVSPGRSGWSRCLLVGRIHHQLLHKSRFDIAYYCIILPQLPQLPLWNSLLEPKNSSLNFGTSKQKPRKIMGKMMENSSLHQLQYPCCFGVPSFPPTHSGRYSKHSAALPTK